MLIIFTAGCQSVHFFFLSAMLFCIFYGSMFYTCTTIKLGIWQTTDTCFSLIIPNFYYKTKRIVQALKTHQTKFVCKNNKNWYCKFKPGSFIYTHLLYITSVWSLFNCASWLNISRTRPLGNNHKPQTYQQVKSTVKKYLGNMTLWNFQRNF